MISKGLKAVMLRSELIRTATFHVVKNKEGGQFVSF